MVAAPADAQVFSWGFKGGLNYGTPYGKAPEGASGELGLGPNLGVFVKYNINQKWGLQAGFSYSFKGGKFKTPFYGDTVYLMEILYNGVPVKVPIVVNYKGMADGKFANIYVDFPLIVSRKIGDRFEVVFGPQVSYLIKAENAGTADVEVGDGFLFVYDEPFDESDQIKEWDYGLVVGINYETLNGWQCGLRFNAGFPSIYKDTYTMLDEEVRNMYLQLTIGYRFGANGFE